MPKSASCAAGILQALRDNNHEQLSRNLLGATPEACLCENSYEGERLELLHGIATQISGVVSTGRLQDAYPYIPLLDHLARLGGQLPDRAFIC
jgi:hypothetical protein